MKNYFTFLKIVLLLFLLSIIYINTYSQISETWELDNLALIGGHPVSVFGDPQVVETDSGKAVIFDGNLDQLIIDANPIGESKKFTVEMIFKPTYTTAEPRVIHIGDTSGSGERVMMEIRISASETTWYLDGYIQTDASENGALTLIDETLIHPLDEWAHAAITYENDTFKTYVNGEQELSGYVIFNQAILDVTDKTSIGARMNGINHFTGHVKTFKVTQAALSPEKFLCNDTVSAGEIFHLSNVIAGGAYPNPAKNFVNIELYANDDIIVLISVIDILGSERIKVLKALHRGYNTLKVDISKLTGGIYFIKYTNSSQPITLRVIR